MKTFEKVFHRKNNLWQEVFNLANKEMLAIDWMVWSLISNVVLGAFLPLLSLLNSFFVLNQPTVQYLNLLHYFFQAIVWDEPLADAIGSIAMFSLLRDQDVVKMFPLRRGRLPIGQNPLTVYKNIIFITRPQVNLMDMIADNIHG